MVSQSTYSPLQIASCGQEAYTTTVMMTMWVEGKGCRLLVMVKARDAMKHPATIEKGPISNETSWLTSPTILKMQ